MHIEYCCHSLVIFCIPYFSVSNLIVSSQRLTMKEHKLLNIQCDMAKHKTEELSFGTIYFKYLLSVPIGKATYIIVES